MQQDPNTKDNSINNLPDGINAGSELLEDHRGELPENSTAILEANNINQGDDPYGN